MTDQVRGLLIEMTDKEVLEAARALLTTPEHWTQGVRARDVSGRPVEPASPDAICWCITGAFARVDNWPIVPMKLQMTLERQAMKRGYSGPVLLNDAPGMEHRLVLEYLDACIAEVAE